ncbi:MAG TPA: 4a-hydroxytetrahydrobiopterin dehydratase [Chthonomonadaceae bacterium]|nr:4a-hydroxytetrahydrobiopterin dehydratase [Chthonomonadaceae bacterium]
MARPSKLTDAEITEGLNSLPGWTLQDGAIQRSFRFRDFVAAWGFMTRVALLAQAMDHHPDWSNVYNTVHIKLSTHDAAGVTRLDLDLARKINEHS